ncbi:MAG: hypothetical protein ACREL6_08080 [Gemmatimonadales bacterium]
MSTVDLLNSIGCAVGVMLIGWGTLWGCRVGLGERHTRRKVPDFVQRSASAKRNDPDPEVLDA